MRRLFAYILKYNFVFLFLLLEMLAFLLIIQNNYQKASFINTSNRVTGSAFQSYSSISEYFSLKKANTQLLVENRDLRKQLNSSSLITDSVIHFNKDSLFSFVEAKVLRNTINKQKNFILINKGSIHGIEPDMGVITSNGIVGTVVEVSEHFSKVMSVLNIQSKVNARIKKNNHLGSIEWSGSDYRIARITDIPLHVLLQEGDTAITSGNSMIFPEGIPIGTIGENITEAGQNFNQYTLHFFVDYNELYSVYVIKNLLKQEVQQLTEDSK